MAELKMTAAEIRKAYAVQTFNSIVHVLLAIDVPVADMHTMIDMDKRLHDTLSDGLAATIGVAVDLIAEERSRG